MDFDKLLNSALFAAKVCAILSAISVLAGFLALVFGLALTWVTIRFGPIFSYLAALMLMFVVLTVVWYRQSE